MTGRTQSPACRFPPPCGAFHFTTGCGPGAVTQTDGLKAIPGEARGTEPNPMLKIMRRGDYRSEHAVVSQLFDCAFIIPACFPSPGGERISLILWLQPRSSR